MSMRLFLISLLKGISKGLVAIGVVGRTRPELRSYHLLPVRILRGICYFLPKKCGSLPRALKGGRLQKRTTLHTLREFTTALMSSKVFESMVSFQHFCIDGNNGATGHSSTLLADENEHTTGGMVTSAQGHQHTWFNKSPSRSLCITCNGTNAIHSYDESWIIIPLSACMKAALPALPLAHNSKRHRGFAPR